VRRNDHPLKNRSLLAGVHVLLVDNEPDARDVLQAMLELCRAIVVTAATAKAAVRILDSIKFDALVADIVMPTRTATGSSTRSEAFRSTGGFPPSQSRPSAGQPTR
jgi:CheY-like chemotaxis protein